MRHPAGHLVAGGDGGVAEHGGEVLPGPPERFVGITVFSSDGNYLVSNVSKKAPYDHYPEELLRALRTCIEVKARNAWQPQGVIRLVFRVFRPLRQVETQAVRSLVEDLTTEYAGVGTVGANRAPSESARKARCQ